MATKHDIQFERITFDPLIKGGRACVRGMPLTVAVVVNQIRNGATVEEVLDGYPDLVREDIEQEMAFSAQRADGR